MKMRNSKNYTDLSKLETYEERFNYLKLGGSVGDDTFGFDRYLNQKFYSSPEWKKVRNQVISRDNGNDLGCSDRPIYDRKIYIHHMIPITKDDIINRNPDILNPEYLISVTKRTHDAIHYGVEECPSNTLIERTKNDTCPWRH